MVHGSIFGDARGAKRGLPALQLQLQRMRARYRLAPAPSRLFVDPDKRVASSLWFITSMAVA
jgi:hypothetical protein